MTVTNGYQHQWSEERVAEALNKTLSSAYLVISQTVEWEDWSFYREAVFLIDAGRVAHVAKLRGFVYPTSEVFLRLAQEVRA